MPSRRHLKRFPGKSIKPEQSNDSSPSKVGFLKLLVTYGPLLFSTASIIISGLAYTVSVRGMKISQRAYLYHEAQLTNMDELVKAVRAKAKEYPATIKFTTKNLGNTPATKVNYDLTYNIPGHTCMHVSSERTPETLVDIGPKDSQSQYFYYTYTGCAGSPLAVPFSTGVTGKIDYDDVFGEHHSITVCYGFLATVEGGVMSPCDQQDYKQGQPLPKLPKIPIDAGKVNIDKDGVLRRDP